MIYLSSTAADAARIMAVPGVDDVCELTDGLLAIDAQLSRSQLYHRLKPMQSKDAPLLVAELIEVPKVKGMAAGSVAWLRDRLPAGAPASTR